MNQLYKCNLVNFTSQPPKLMINFFRKTRKKLADDNKFVKYSRYAIGEIVLVVIGILIALQINNWNEERKEREKFDNILIEVRKELIENIFNIRDNIDFYYMADSILQPFIHDSLNEIDYSDINNWIAFHIPYYFEIPVIKDASYKKLIDINDISEEQEILVNELNLLYNVPKSNLEESKEWVKSVVKESEKKIKKKVWYKNWVLQNAKPTEEMKDYFVNSPEFMNTAVEYAETMLFNLRANLEGFEIQSTNTFRNIHSYLNNGGISHSDSLLFQYEASQYDYLLGVYEANWYSNIYHNRLDSSVISIEKKKLFYTQYWIDGGNDKREIIPVSKYYFRTVLGDGFYHIEYDDLNKVISVKHSEGYQFVRERKIK